MLEKKNQVARAWEIIHSLLVSLAHSCQIMKVRALLHRVSVSFQIQCDYNGLFAISEIISFFQDSEIIEIKRLA